MRSDALPTIRATPRRQARRAATAGFTIVELLVVIAIIAVLMGLLVVGLRGAIGSSRKMRELNFLKGIHTAWELYSNNSDEQLLPGYLPVETQTAWSVTYRNSAGQAVPAALAQTYPWRMASYFGKEAFAAFLGYNDFGSTTEGSNDPSMEWPTDMGTTPAWMSPSLGTPGSAIAFQPVAGYNAYFIGGWYQQNAAGAAQPRFIDAAWTDQSGNARTGGLVSTRKSQIEHTTEVVVFATSTYRAAGNYSVTGEDQTAGSAWIAAPRLGTQQVWQPYVGTPQNVASAESEGGSAALVPQTAWVDSGYLQVLSANSVPIRRHNRLAAVLHADGSAESLSVGALMDMRLWIDKADTPDFQHGD